MFIAALPKGQGSAVPNVAWKNRAMTCPKNIQAK